MSCPIRWPHTVACAGHGVCVVNGTRAVCVCDSGWESSGDMLVDSNECSIHRPTLTVLWSITLALVLAGCVFGVRKLRVAWQFQRRWLTPVVLQPLLYVLSMLWFAAAIALKLALAQSVGNEYAVTVFFWAASTCVTCSGYAAVAAIFAVLLRILPASGGSHELALRVVALLRRALAVPVTVSALVMVPGFVLCAAREPAQDAVIVVFALFAFGSAAFGAGPPLWAVLRLARILREDAPDASSAQVRNAAAARLLSAAKKVVLVVAQFAVFTVLALSWPFIFYKSPYVFIAGMMGVVLWATGMLAVLQAHSSRTVAVVAPQSPLARDATLNSEAGGAGRGGGGAGFDASVASARGVDRSKDGGGLATGGSPFSGDAEAAPLSSQGRKADGRAKARGHTLEVVSRR